MISRLLSVLILASIAATVQPGRAKTISWAGLNWTVRSGSGGPGPNEWSDSTNNVWVDTEGRLHLKIFQDGGTWYCAEIYSVLSFSFGEYRFKVATPYDQFGTNVVGGLFTYLDDTNEIDIEFNRAWTGTNNANFATQPAWIEGNYLYHYAQFTEGSYSTHRFIWETNQIFFQSYFGHTDPPPESNLTIATWTYTGEDIPPDEGEKVHLNMWLYQGRAPTDTQHLELIVNDFTYIPLSNSIPTQHISDVFYDDFNDSGYLDKWNVNNNSDFSVQLNGCLRVQTDNIGKDQSGLVTMNHLSWLSSSGCVFQANLKEVDVIQTNSINGTDVKTLLAAVSDGRYRGTLYFATNAAALLGAYIGVSNQYRLEFYSKTNNPTGFGTERYSGVITNVSDYLAQGPMTVGFLLDSNRFQVFARDYLGNEIPVQSGTSNGIGFHHLGDAFTSAWWAVGVLNWTNGIAYAHYDETSVYISDPVSDDIDGDALSDTWEYEHRGNLVDLFALGDYDDDGFPDTSEYRAGTDPTNCYSALQFNASDAVPDGFVIVWQSVSNRNYAVERSLQLDNPPAFSGLATQAATPPMNVYTDTTATGSGACIYRVRLE